MMMVCNIELLHALSHCMRFPRLNSLSPTKFASLFSWGLSTDDYVKGGKFAIYLRGGQGVLRKRATDETFRIPIEEDFTGAWRGKEMTDLPGLVFGAASGLGL